MKNNAAHFTISNALFQSLLIVGSFALIVLGIVTALELTVGYEPSFRSLLVVLVGTAAVYLAVAYIAPAKIARQVLRKRAGNHAR